VVGPNATSIEALLGNYPGYSDTLTTLLEGIIGRAPEGVRVSYRMGVLLHEAASSLNDWTVSNAAAADVTIACMGYSPLLESEEGDALLSTAMSDRTDIVYRLPRYNLSRI